MALSRPWSSCLDVMERLCWSQPFLGYWLGTWDLRILLEFSEADEHLGPSSSRCLYWISPGRCFRAELKRASADMTRCMWRDRDSVSFWSQPQRLDIGCDHIEVISEGHNRWFACAQLNSLPFAIARAGRAVLHATCTPRNMHTTATQGEKLAKLGKFSDI